MTAAGVRNRAADGPHRGACGHRQAQGARNCSHRPGAPACSEITRCCAPLAGARVGGVALRPRGVPAPPPARGQEQPIEGDPEVALSEPNGRALALASGTVAALPSARREPGRLPASALQGYLSSKTTTTFAVMSS